MAESWVRLWAGMTTDPKFRVVARKSGRPLMEVLAVFTHLLLLANEAEERGNVDDEDVELIAAALDADEDHINAILDAMQGRVIDGGRLSGWDKRQPVREDSGNEKTGALSGTERVRRYREKQRDETQCNATKRDETQCNAPDTDTDTEAEESTPFAPSDCIASAQKQPKQSKHPITFDIESGSFTGLNGSMAVWERAYPAVNIETEIAKAAAWLVANPANSKSNYPRFLANWLSRAQDRAPRVNSEPDYSSVR